MAMTQEELVKELRSIDSDKEYYAITLLGTADGKMGGGKPALDPFFFSLI